MCYSKCLSSLSTVDQPVTKLTTGALIFALNSRKARDISQQIQSRTMEKRYLAVVRGGSKSFSNPHGQIKKTLSIDSEGRVNLASSSELASNKAPAKLKESWTDWELLGSSVCRPYLLTHGVPHRHFRT